MLQQHSYFCQCPQQEGADSPSGINPTARAKADIKTHGGGTLRSILLAVVLSLGQLVSRANIVLPQVLGNDMVVQCQKPVTIWGQEAPGVKITVSFRGQHKTVMSDLNGHWILYLDPMSASDRPADMTIEGQDRVVLHNILTGEVWLCSGQSNMEYTMRKNSKVAKTGSAVVAGLGHSPVDELQYAHNHNIRIFLGLRKPLAKPHPQHEGWSVAEDSALRSFSAAGYFFARRLYKELKVPIGIIANAVPGSAIEPWLAGKVDQLDPHNQMPYFDYSEPGKFFSLLVEPLAPFTIRGLLWYQGETNCFMNESISYAYKMKALIQQWRTLWSDSTLPFYYVQIAPFYYSKSKGNYPLDVYTLPRFWEAQTLCLRIPHTGMVVSTDLPDNLNNIHPPGKWAVGERLAAIALHKTYGKANVVCSGPAYLRKAEKGHELRLYFAHTDGGLVTRDGGLPDDFEVAGKEGVFYPASAVLQGDHVVVSSPKVPRPQQARFAWSEAAQPNLVNKAGLPAEPFRTDNPYQLSTAGAAFDHF